MPDDAGPTWSVPGPVGYPEAIAGMGTVAAPLLAGFALTLLGIVLTAPASLRWPDTVGLFLTIATVTLLATVQFTFWARQYAVTSAELADWWPDSSEPDRHAMLRDEQWSYRATHDLWARRASRSYIVGVIALLIGVALVLVPVGHFGHIRLAAFAIVCLAVVLEAAWVIVGKLPRRILSGRFATWRGLVLPILPPREES